MKGIPGWALCFFFLLFLAYANHFDNGFYFDDGHAIVDNNYIRDLGNLPLFFADGTTFSSLPANQAYRPMVTALNAVDYWLAGGLDPRYFHVSIFLGYILQLVLMFLVFRRLFDRALAHPWNPYLALLGTAVYGLHPANAETLNYIIARSDSFSTLMVVAVMAIFLHADARKRYWSFIPLLAGMLAKPTALMVAPMIFVFVLLYENDITISGSRRIKGLVFPVLLALFGLGVYGLVHLMTPATWVPGGTSRWQYLITQPLVILDYFFTFFLPIHLSADTDWGLLTTVFDFRFAVGALFVLALLAASYYCARKREYYPIAFGLLWFLFALAPTSSFVPLAEVKNDHRLFYPFVGLALSLGWAIGLVVFKHEERIRRSTWLRRGLLLGAAGLVGACAYGTHQRNRVWDSDESLWHDVVQKSPENGRGLMNYGLTQMSQGRYETAREYFDRALALAPNYAYLHINIAILEEATGNGEKSEAHFRQALSLDRGNPAAHFYYAKWLLEKGRKEEGKRLLEGCLALSPGHVEAGELWQRLVVDDLIEQSLEHYRAGQFELCIEACLEALELDPRSAVAYNNLCSAYNALGQWQKGVEACEKALAIDPGFELARNNLRWALSLGQ